MANKFGHLIKRVAVFLVVPVLAVGSLPALTASATPAFQLPMRGNVELIGYINNGDHAGEDTYAVDLTSDNTAVYPAADGTIVHSEYNCDTAPGATSCYGNVVAIDHGDDYYSIYTHLACDSYFDDLVNGTPVTTATRIGTMSNTGHELSDCNDPATGNEHLHFAVRSSADENDVLFTGDPVNVWQYTSAGGSHWIPGLTWPQATSAYNSWSVSLSADKTSATAGEDVTLTAQVSSNAVSSVPPFSVVITEPSTSTVVETCTTLPCVGTVNASSASTHTYKAFIMYETSLSPATVVTMAESSAVGVTWNNPTWSHIPGGTATAFRISAVSTNDVWAAGGSSIQHWDGTSWAASPYSLTGTFIHDIKAFASNDVWVVGYASSGGVQQTMTAHWDGTAWTRITSPNPSAFNNTLTSIDGMFPNDIWAVGGYSPGGGQPAHTLAMRWNGTSWTTVSTPGAGFGGGFDAVSVVLPNDVWAVGTYTPGFGQQGRPYTARWNGTSWQAVTAPTVNPAQRWSLLSVDAAAQNDVWAVGSVFNSTPPPPTDLIERWNGTSWQIVSSPCPTNRCFLNDVAALASNDVWTVGWWVDTDNTSNTLIKHWDGTSWTVMPSPSPANHMNHSFGIGPVSATDIWVLGRMSPTSGSPHQPLYLRYH